jgi:hypothetical protein
MPLMSATQKPKTAAMNAQTFRIARGYCHPTIFEMAKCRTANHLLSRRQIRAWGLACQTDPLPFALRSH